MVKSVRKKTQKGAHAYLPNALQGILGDSWFPGAEEIANAGLVDDVRDLARLSKEEQEKKVSEASDILNKPSLKDRFKNFFKSAGTELKKAALGTEGETKRLSTLTPEQEKFLKEYLGYVGPELISELDYLKQLREKPMLEQAFGEYAPYAGVLGANLLGQLSAPQAHPFTTNEPGGAGMQGQLLSSLLGVLASQSPQVQSFARQGAERLGQYGQQGLQQAGQLGSYLQSRGSSALDYLRNLVGR